MFFPRAVNALISWLEDITYLRLVRNAGWLTGSTLISGILGLSAITLAAKNIGASNFGNIIMVITYVGIVNKLLNFQSWQFLMKNGAISLLQNDTDRLRRLIKFSALLDVGGAVASTIVAFLCASYVGEILGWSDNTTYFAELFSFTILFQLTGMPSAVLRLLNQFKTLAIQKVLLGSLNLIGVIIALLISSGAESILLAFAISNVISSLYLILMAWHQLSKNKIKKVWRSSLSGICSHEKHIWHFVFYSNIESSIKIFRDIDIFLIKYFLSSEAVGLYALGRRIAEALHMIIDSFFQAIYPEFSKIIASHDKATLYRLIKQSSLSVGGFSTLLWIAFLLLGQWLIPAIFGLSFSSTYELASICMLGNVIWAFSQPISPILYNLGQAKNVFRITTASISIYIISLLIMLPKLGAIGAAISYTAYFLVWVIFTSLAVRHCLKVYTWEAE